MKIVFSRGPWRIVCIDNKYYVEVQNLSGNWSREYTGGNTTLEYCQNYIDNHE